jgi:2-polyprenyl-3-methyl-5-hydroxy-6-metoxy-1,4-benzoquinol methylase
MSPLVPPDPSPPPAAALEPVAQQVFADIYRHAKWGKNTQGAGSSGSGSTLRSTLLYRTFLQQFLKDNEIRSVVDAGCGDWEFSQALDWSGIDYKGFDIVESAIAQDKQKFTKPNIQFFFGNFLELDLPPADLLICKHVLQHLPTRDVQRFLTQATKYKHLLLTSSVNARTMSAANGDIVVGDYRELDPTTPPFNLRGTKALMYWDGSHMHQVVHIAGRT